MATTNGMDILIPLQSRCWVDSLRQTKVGMLRGRRRLGRLHVELLNERRLFTMPMYHDIGKMQRLMLHTVTTYVVPIYKKLSSLLNKETTHIKACSCPYLYLPFEPLLLLDLTHTHAIHQSNQLCILSPKQVTLWMPIKP